MIADLHENSLVNIIIVQNNARRFVGLDIFYFRTDFRYFFLAESKTGGVAAVRNFL
jgi:hypothetical protein